MARPPVTRLLQAHTLEHTGEPSPASRPQELYERSGSEVPHVFADILRWLAAHGLNQPDVFAQPSRTTEVARLCRLYDNMDNSDAGCSPLPADVEPAAVRAGAPAAIACNLSLGNWVRAQLLCAVGKPPTTGVVHVWMDQTKTIIIIPAETPAFFFTLRHTSTLPCVNAVTFACVCKQAKPNPTLCTLHACQKRLQVGSLLKRWLEALPEPLLSWEQQVDMLTACTSSDISLRVEDLRQATLLVSCWAKRACACVCVGDGGGLSTITTRPCFSKAG